MSDSLTNSERRKAVLFGDLDLRALRGIEIGPLNAPIIRKTDGDIFYVDHATQDELVRKYQNDSNVTVADIQPVDAVWGENSLVDMVGRDFADYVIASHVAEHVPDLVGWLREIEAVLRHGGQLCLVLPDKRMSYDCRRRDTVLVDVLDAYIRKAKKPQTYQLLDCALRVAVTDHVKLFHGETVPEDYPFIHSVESAMNIARHALENDVYTDIHCWVVTPKSFARLMFDLVSADLVGFACSGFTDTRAENAFEFFMKLQAGATKAEALESWSRMEEAASLYVRGSAAERLFSSGETGRR